MKAPVLPARLAALVAMHAACAGCFHHRFGRPGPGHVDLWTAPPALASGGTALPDPLPTRALIVSPGVLAGAGGRFDDDGSHAEGALGFELGVYGTHIPGYETRIFEREGLDPAWLRTSFGVNLGWTPLATRSSSAGIRPPTAYVELQDRTDLCLLCGFAAGVALSPGDWRRQRTALQLTPLFGPLYLRFQWLLSGAVAVEAGLAIKVPFMLSFGG